MDTHPDWYEVLGVSRGASPAIIKAAYRAHAKASHPDSAHQEGDTDFGLITQAYDVLSDPERRKEYDDALDAQKAQAGAGEGSDAENDDEFVDAWGSEDKWNPEYEYTSESFAEEDPRKLAGFDAWSKLPITPDQLSWLEQARSNQQFYVPATHVQTADIPEPEREESEQTGFIAKVARKKATLAICIGVWILALFAHGFSAGLLSSSVFTFGAFFGVFVFGFPQALGLRGVVPRIWAWLYLVLGVLVVPIMAVVGLGNTQGGPPGVKITALIVAVVATVAMGGAFLLALESINVIRERRKSDPNPVKLNADGLVPAEQVEQFRQWGNPGRGLNDRRSVPFSERNADLGFGGEILTSQLIDPLTQIPGLRVVHSISVPGFGEADFDHVILCGNLLVVVDSKNWSGGSYYWLSGQIMSTTPSGLQRRGNPMEWGLEAFHREFPDKALVPIVLIHSHNDYPVATNNQNRGANPILMSPIEFVEQVGQMCVDQRATGVDRVALTKLISLMK